ncbi:MaoC/PaaZ C-terminal domain-containing protein [Nocardioides euryhalodurans]|uniref:Uncharacterized protein n=1 Tax=Nocardioides euryhalodurans TaxID=2518370 RepID=A0A4P7GLC5_9ACTN|nr:MaoC/PaaZ C-terminal domain-containing protein [Nocardioides euryhalodurans]QBR92840.1 hypothetical protein EXE57_11550 [Nocardioides euryhalodurans]
MSALVEGTALPGQAVVPTLRQLVRYAGASRDFYEMHYDLDVARDQGHRELSVHGLLKAALLGRYVRGQVPAGGRLRSLQVSYRGMDFRDEEMRLGGRVVSVADGVARLEIWIDSVDGTRSTLGEAEVEQP